jgi:hypothetical protein
MILSVDQGCRGRLTQRLSEPVLQSNKTRVDFEVGLGIPEIVNVRDSTSRFGG